MAELARTSARVPHIDYAEWRADMDAMIDQGIPAGNGSDQSGPVGSVSIQPTLSGNRYATMPPAACECAGGIEFSRRTGGNSVQRPDHRLRTGEQRAGSR